MTLELSLFYLISIVVIVSALLVVSLRNLVRSIFLFFVTLFGMAGLYIFALADFIAIAQVIVYVGGVLVLMLFAFMLSNRELLNQLEQGITGIFSMPKWQALVVALIFLGIALSVAFNFHHNEPAWIENAKMENAVIKANDNTIHHLGIHLMTHFLLPFEVISIFLMMALIGAAHLSRKVRLK